MNVEQAAEAIRTMEVRGAAAIGRTAAEALGEAAEAYEGDAAGFYPHLLEEAEALLKTRPTAVSLKNAVNHVLRAVKERADEGASGAGTGAGAELSVLQRAARSAADAFSKRSREALQRIAELGAARIDDGDTVLTHCNSQAALGGVLKAAKEGKAVTVYATESRPFGQGLITVGQLAEAGVPARYVVDMAVGHVMEHVDVVMTGADAITATGTVVNKIGTRMVALAARAAGVPFYTCAETYKFHPDTLDGKGVPIETRPVEEVIDPDELPDGVEVENPVFDFTPARYVDAIVTEVGVVRAHEATRIIREHVGVGPL